MRFASEIYLVDMAQELVQKILERHKVIDDEIFWVSLAVRETLINAAKHGNQYAADKRIGLRLDFEDGLLGLEVSDEGAGFDLEAVPDPLSEENLLKPSGRGIFYVKSFMDRVEFRRNKPQGTLVRMEKKLHYKSSVKQEQGA